MTADTKSKYSPRTSMPNNFLNNLFRRIFSTSFDYRLENFLNKLLEIDGAKEVLKNLSRGKLLFFQIKTVKELIVFKSTFLNNYIPDAEKKARAFRKKVIRSRYREYLQEINFDHNVNELVLDGYVKLFHKLESYRSELINLIDNRITEITGVEANVEKYLKERYKYAINDLKNYPETIYSINWICNCAKHYGGYPKKKNPPAKYKDLDQTKVLTLSKNELSTDIDYMIDFINRLFKGAMLAAISMRFEIIFDTAGDQTKDQLGPTAAMLAALAVVYYSSLNKESDSNFQKSFEDFITYYTNKQHQPVSS
jgi:hypothetical protein